MPGRIRTVPGDVEAKLPKEPVTLEPIE